MYHFISGLPRSGSTLLAALLNQRHDCYADGLISPLGTITNRLQQAFSPSEETHILINEKQRRDMVEAVFDAFYEEHLNKIVFDTNRRWCQTAELIGRVFPQSRIICCVRSPLDIINSFEALFRANPTQASTVIGSDPSLGVYERVRNMLTDNSVVGYALNAFKDAFYGPSFPRLLIIEYEFLASDTQNVMNWLTDNLGLERFEYNLDLVIGPPNAEEFDKSIGTPGLHRLRPKVSFIPQLMMIPPDLQTTVPAPFWRQPGSFLLNKEATKPR